MLVRFASLAFRAPDVTLASVRTLAASGPTVSVVFCGWGWGCSNLWRDEGADRWASFIGKKLELNTKSHLGLDPALSKLRLWEKFNCAGSLTGGLVGSTGDGKFAVGDA